MIGGSEGEAIAAAYGLARPGDAVALSGPVARGQLGRVWRLTVGDRSFAVKEWYAGPRLEEVGRDAGFVDAARALGVRTPEVLRTTDGRVGADVDGTVARVFEWVDLRPRTRSLDPAEVGRTVALLHRAARPSEEPVDNWFATGAGEQSWRDLARRVADEKAPFTGQLRALVDDLVAVESVIEPHESPLVCHRDLWSDNVLATTDGAVCVIDFENLGPADPSQELAMVLFEFGEDDPARARILHDAYRAAGGPGRVTRRGHFSMLVAEQAHIGQLACSRWVGADDGPERDRLADWFLEIPEDPVTLARIDRVLAAVS
ncbi:phosphotransferase enzyme family protein [Intrasporangium sp. YIM S08009]|uniref:phosphotransferase enzyme family protein n=1 Tax=Intrasporangium zincisolvens TaxID=3080018 RepID=UPI002B06248E|nr:phosphotransferase [Intrasporangium sp. YIM S08009]